MGNGQARLRKSVLARIHCQQDLDAFLSRLQPMTRPHAFERVKQWLPFVAVNNFDESVPPELVEATKTESVVNVVE
jgi:hypothetical protein